MSYRFALAGTGGIAAVHAQAILNQPDAIPSAVVTTKVDGAQEFRSKFQIPDAFPSVEALVQAGGADALIICTPNALHAPQTITALRGGLHVMVEKPMAMNAQEALAMLDASRSSGKQLMVGHCWRFDSDVLWLREKARSGVLGNIIRTKSYGVHTHWGPSGWFAQKELAGGGALADMGIHAIDTSRFLLGDPLPVSVFAKVGTFYCDADVDDTGVLIVNWDNGAISYIESGWWQPHVDGPESSTQLYGTQGFGSVFPTRLRLPNPVTRRVETLESGFTFPRADHSPQGIYDRQMAYFIECIRENCVPVPGGREGWINMQICDAAYESSRSGKLVAFQTEEG